MDEPYIEMFARGLRGAWSHPDPVEVIENVEYEDAGKKAGEFEHSIWQMTSHMLDWSRQILDKLLESKDIKSVGSDNFFPLNAKPESEDEWIKCRQAFADLIDQTTKLLPELDPKTRVSEWNNITAVDALMIMVTHNSYHISKIVEIRKALGIWGGE